ncbi:hypothetical protein ACQW02_16185 [Humitalea sp. 24SJ18S-53]|uniref:hypothetical protein n=1 Tax=Humitalea sp. 24SJ18S-53 TaxID=3422307 RepID=UPI003D66455C
MSVHAHASRARLLGLTALTLVAFTVQAQAQSMGSREFQNAELTELSPALQAEVTARATGGNTPRGVLETMLLNGIQARYPASRIIALDMGRGIVVIATTDNQMRAMTFNKQEGLNVIGEVSLTR